MNVFSRFASLVTVNVQGLLDKMENPERMLAELVAALEEGLATARRQAANAVAAERGLQRDLDEHRAAAAGWKERARLALAQQREDLARRALAHKLDHDSLLRSLEVQHAAAQQLATDMRASFHTLKIRSAETRRKQRALEARQRAAQVHLQLQRSFGADLAQPLAIFEQLERKLQCREDELRAEIELTSAEESLERELHQLDRGARLEEELTALQKEREAPAVQPEPEARAREKETLASASGSASAP